MKKIQNTLPEARFIHVIRDGRDAGLSQNARFISAARSRQAARDGTTLAQAGAQVAQKKKKKKKKKKERALPALGFDGVSHVRIGRLVELEAEDGADLEALCEKLLANPLIEDYEVVREGAEGD